MPTPELALEMRDIEMRFSGVPVLRDVSFILEPGIVHAIVGHNGAGKSTLMKIAQGVHRPTRGEVYVGGVRMDHADAGVARSLGIGMVFQEKSLIPTLTGLDNLFLNDERVTPARSLRRQAEWGEVRELLDRLGIPPSLLKRHVSELSIVEQQLLEIAKALRLASRVMILDEPTAPLGHQEIGRLFQVVRNVARHGVGVILITHHLGEVFEVSDKVTVMREGRVTLSCPASQTSVPGLVKAMLGDREIHVNEPGRRQIQRRTSDPAMDVRSLEVRGKLSDVSFQLYPEEIVGLVGLAGSGRSTLMRTLFGDIRRSSGDVLLLGKPYHPRHPADAIRNGVYLIPEDRAVHGLLLTKAILENSSLSILRQFVSWGVLRMSRGRHKARELMSLLGIRARGPEQVVTELSGGNQQKVVVAKVLGTMPKLLLLDEPTYGVDVGAASDLAQYVRSEAASGMAVLWASSDVEELVRVADRILVLADGTIRAALTAGSPDFTESSLIEAMQRSSHRQVQPGTAGQPG
jgi:ABC-type sugar transport system ATPase subunit